MARPWKRFTSPTSERQRGVLAKHEVEHLFIGKVSAILQGHPDTTQDADLFVENAPHNRRKLTGALRDLGFGIGNRERPTSSAGAK